MRRRLLVPLVAFVLVVAAACSDDSGGGDTEAPLVTSPAVILELNELDVHLDTPGERPRAVLEQSVNTGATWDGGLEFNLGVESVLAARAIGDATLVVTDVDEDGNATAQYTLDGLDVAIGPGNGDAGQTTPDALGVSGEVVVAPDRGGTATATARVEANGSVPGAEGLAGSLDPRLTFLLLPFPEEPVGIGAGWTITGPIPVFNTTVVLEAQVELTDRVDDRYELAVTIAMVPETEDGVDLRLEGLGRVEGDLDQLGLLTATMALTGTAVLPDRGPDPLAMTLRLDVEQRHSDDAGAGTTS